MKKFFETFGRILKTRVHIDTVPSREVEEPRPDNGVVVEDIPIIAAVCNEEKETVCGICLEVYVDPFLTTCKHTFCTPCLSRICEFKETARIPCPTCRTPLNLAKFVNYPLKKNYYPPFNLNNYPADANFDFIRNFHEMLMISSAYHVICREGKWETLYKVDTLGFTWFQRDPEITDIMCKINEKYNDCRSGYSMGYVMLHVHFISKYGFREYKNIFTSITPT